MEQNRNKWINEIKSINKDNLVSIIRFNKNRVTVILKEINFNNLLENSRLSRKLQRKNIIPLYLTEEHIKTSRDVYPLEYLKMKKGLEILYGSDILRGLKIPGENIRLECEQKIKGALIRMTQVILECGSNRKKLLNIAFLALEDILSGMEGMLEISGIPGYESEVDLIQEAESRFKLELSPVKEISAWKDGKKPKDVKKLIYAFYEKMEELAGFVDRMEISA